MKAKVSVQKTVYGYLELELPEDFLEKTVRARKTRIKELALERLKDAPESAVWDEDDVYMEASSVYMAEEPD